MQPHQSSSEACSTLGNMQRLHQVGLPRVVTLARQAHQAALPSLATVSPPQLLHQAARVPLTVGHLAHHLSFGIKARQSVHQSRSAASVQRPHQARLPGWAQAAESPRPGRRERSAAGCKGSLSSGGNGSRVVAGEAAAAGESTPVGGGAPAGRSLAAAPDDGAGPAVFVGVTAAAGGLGVGAFGAAAVAAGAVAGAAAPVAFPFLSAVGFGRCTPSANQNATTAMAAMLNTANRATNRPLRAALAMGPCSPLASLDVAPRPARNPGGSEAPSVRGTGGFSSAGRWRPSAVAVAVPPSFGAPKPAQARNASSMASAEG